MKGNKLDKKNYKIQNYLLKKCKNDDNKFFIKTQNIQTPRLIIKNFPNINNLSNRETISTNYDSNNNKHSYTSRNPIVFNNYYNTITTKFNNKIISKFINNNNNIIINKNKSDDILNKLQDLEKIDKENEIKINNIKKKNFKNDNEKIKKQYIKKDKTFSQYFLNRYSPKNYCKTNLTNFITKDIESFNKKFNNHTKFFKQLESNENNLQKIKIIFNYITPYVEKERNKYENKYKIFFNNQKKFLTEQENKRKFFEKQKILLNKNIKQIKVDLLYNLKNNILNDLQQSKLSLINKNRKENILYKISDE